MVNDRNRLLSFILEQFMMSSDVHEDEQKEETFTDEKLAALLNFNFFEYKFSGSSAENLYIPFCSNMKSDVDLMFEFPYMSVVDPEQLTLEEQQQCKANGRYSLLNIEYKNKKYPCYVTLYSYRSREITVTNENTDLSVAIPTTDRYVIFGDFVGPCKEYFPSLGFVHWFSSARLVDKSYEENIEFHGPSVCTMSNNPNLPLPMDHVSAMKCIHWPKPAVNWIHRTRKSNWPDKNFINSIIKFGCHVVPLSHVLTVDEEKKNEWRLSFSMCELLLAKMLNMYQRKCYLILKALIDVHIKQDSELSKSICTYYLKTILFWLCELIEKEQWTYDTLYDRLIDFIDYIITCFENKCLNHYFISEMNLIDHLDNKYLKKISEKCLLIKKDLINMIKTCEEYYWNTDQFKRFDPVIEILTKNENLNDNSCIIICCANTMRALIEQHKLIDHSLKIVNDCIKRQYLESCSDEAARYLLYATSLITHLFNDQNEYSAQSLSTYNAMMKICEAKLFYDQLYEDMKINYIEIQNHLNFPNN